MKYLREFQTEEDYNNAKDNLDLPNVSLITETKGVEYKPYIPPQPITYTASAKLAEVTSTWDSGLHTNAFSGKNGQLTITSHTFENGIGTIEFNGDVTSIGGWAFFDSDMTSVTIPNSVTSIGKNAFNSCSSLTNITIPDGVTSIGNSAFFGCPSLTSVTIGSGVTSIGEYAFGYCTEGLTSITSLATTAPTIVDNTFSYIKEGGTLTVPRGSTGYDVWMGTGEYYLGKYNWTKVEQ